MDGVPAVLEKLNTMEWRVLILLAVMSALWIILRFMERRALRKHEAAMQEHKDRRSNSYTAALTELSSSFNRHDEKEDRNTASLNVTILRNTEALVQVKEKLADLSRKSQGVMSMGDSVTIADAYYSHLCRRCQSVLEQSLRENDYKKRKVHVTRKVRTCFADEIYAAREELRRISTLAFNPDAFFRVYVSDESTSPVPLGGDRFVLCDILWTSIEACFETRVGTTAIAADKERDLQQRIEEASLLLKNAVHDHFATCVRRLETETSRSLRESISDPGRCGYSSDLEAHPTTG